MAQSATLGILKSAGKPMRAVDIVAKASEGLPKKVSAGLIGRDLRKLEEKGEAKQNADRTWEAVSEPKTPAPQDEKAQDTAKAPAQPKEVRVRINVTKGAETGHTDSGIDGPYTNADGHDVNTKRGCRKCASLLTERKAGTAAPATPSGMTTEQFDEMVYETFQNVETQDPLHVAFALGRAGVLSRISQTPLVVESFKRLAKAGRISKI